MPNRTRHTPTRSLPPVTLAGILIALLALAGCTLPPPPANLPPLPQSPLLPAAGSEAVGDEMAQRVEFDLGTSTATVSGTLAAGSEANYALAANTGQTVTIETSGETSGTAASVAISVHGPGGASWSGTAPAAAGDTVVTAEFVAPALGDYLVTLAAPAAGAETDYTAAFTVVPNAVARIAFPAGTNVDQRSGMLPSGEGTQQFLLSGNAGWTLAVDATSDGAPLSMTIADPAGMQRIPEMRATGTGADIGYAIGHEFALPLPGYYLVTLAKGEHSPSTTYTVTFTLQAED